METLEKENILPWSNFKQFFFLEESENISKCGKNFSVLCKLCLPRKNLLQATSSSSSNLRRHVKRVHPTALSKIEKIGSGSVSKRKRGESESDTDSENNKKSKQLTLPGFSSGSFLTQQRVDKAIQNFIVKGLHSFSTVERPEFREMILALRPDKTVMTRKTLVSRLNEEAASFKKELKDELSKVSFVATTADCWKGLNRSYMGITVHWIDKESLDRKMAILACRRMIGRHTFAEIGKVLVNVNEEYAIQNKIRGTTTDNGSNFVKAFRVFQTDADADDNTESDFRFVEIESILSNEEETEVAYQLPPHERCAAHTLNLIATTDADAASDLVYKKNLRGALSRCNGLWKKQSSSTLHADLIKEKLGIYFIQPNDTRWNSTFDALMCISRILENKCDELQSLCDELGMPRFRNEDMSFIHEYCKVMKPVAVSLDTLQTEKNAYMGVLLPVLHSLRRRLIKLKESDEVTTCSSLLDLLIKSIDERFQQQWFRKDLVLAAVLHPEYQFSWIKDKVKEETAKKWLKEVIKAEGIKIDESTPTEEEANVENEDSIFDFKRVQKKSKKKPSELQLDAYLNTSTNLQSLNALPLIKDLFIKYNTCVPSSAAVERAFSVGGDIFQYKRGRLSDENFENTLILKVGLK